MSIRVIRLVIHMKYRMHSAGSFGLLIKVKVTFRNADQMCMCFVSLIYMCIVCVCVCGVAGIRSYPSNILKRLRRKYHISVICHASHLQRTHTHTHTHTHTGLVYWTGISMYCCMYSTGVLYEGGGKR